MPNSGILFVCPNQLNLRSDTVTVRERNSPLLRSVQIGPGAHLAAHSVRNDGSFPAR